jgi:hypothetical protein
LARAATCPCCERRSGPQTLSGCYEVFVELLLFLLGCLLGCLLCLLRFLGHVALRDPKSLVQCKSTIDMHHLEYTTIAKLILRASKKVNDRRTVATCEWMRPSREAWTQRALMIGILSHRCGDRVSNRNQCSAGTMRRGLTTSSFFTATRRSAGAGARGCTPNSNRADQTSGWGHADRQSILSFALRTTLPHFSISSLIRAPNSSGVSTTALKPSTLRRSLTSGCLTALAVSL